MENEEEQEEEEGRNNLGAFFAGAVLGVIAVGLVAFMSWPAPTRNMGFEGTIIPNSCPEGYNCHTELTKKTPEESIEDLRDNMNQLKTQVRDLQDLPTAKKEVREVARLAEEQRKKECAQPGVLCLNGGAWTTVNPSGYEDPRAKYGVTQ